MSQQQIEIELTELKNKRAELQKNIDSQKDYFFIYGYVKQLEEVDRKISRR